MILFAVAKYVILFLCATLFVWFALFFLEETPTSTAGERERERQRSKKKGMHGCIILEAQPYWSWPEFCGMAGTLSSSSSSSSSRIT